MNMLTRVGRHENYGLQPSTVALDLVHCIESGGTAPP